MSRTYRHRHLPRVRGCVLKFIDGSARAPCHRIDEKVESFYAHEINDAPCVVGGSEVINSGWRKSHGRCAYAAGLPYLFLWSRESCLREFLGLAYPVGRVGSHPWASWFSGGNSGKTYERTRGNRACRRKTNLTLFRLKKSGYAWDDFEEAFPHPRYEIDPWSWD